MTESRGLVVISADGQLHRYEDTITLTGHGAPSIMDINGARYVLYRCTLFGLSGRLVGFIASLEPPTKDERDRAAAELFGPRVFGVTQLERVDDAVESA